MKLISPLTAYPDSFEDGEDFDDIIGGTEQKISRPLSVPGSPRDRSGMMTPGDFASLQEGREELSTEDYISWKLPYVCSSVFLFPFQLPFSLLLSLSVLPLQAAFLALSPQKY